MIKKTSNMVCELNGETTVDMLQNVHPNSSLSGSSTVQTWFRLPFCRWPRRDGVYNISSNITRRELPNLPVYILLGINPCGPYHPNFERRNPSDRLPFIPCCPLCKSIVFVRKRQRAVVVSWHLDEGPR